MTEKRYILSHNGKEDGILDKTNDKGYYGFELARLVNDLSEENEKLKKYNKSQELEIIRLHNLADTMSAVLRELGIYDVYNDEQIENVKRRILE